MIVKRVTAALRRQDWAAVSIEFLLVVAGVLLGFQINEWAIERQQRSERSQATLRLLDEAEQTVAFFRLGVSAQEQVVDDLGYVLGQLRNGGWRGADRTRMTMGLSRALEATTPAPPSSVYDDLIGSGALSKIGDPELRYRIGRYRSALLFHTQTIEYFRQRMPPLEDYPALHYEYDQSGPRPTRLSVDFAALEQDTQLQEKLAIIAEWQTIALILRRRNLKRAEEMCVDVARVAKRNCNLNRPAPSFD